MSSDDEPVQPPLDRQGQHFQRLAKTAAALARTAEESARVHDQMVDRLPGAADHAASDRVLAAAETEAAEAFRRHEVPSPAVREAIRGARADADAAAPAESDSTIDRPPGDRT